MAVGPSGRFKYSTVGAKTSGRAVLTGLFFSRLAFLPRRLTFAFVTAIARLIYLAPDSLMQRSIQFKISISTLLKSTDMLPALKGIGAVVFVLLQVIAELATFVKPAILAGFWIIFFIFPPLK
jgi:hypothetical protein